MKQKIVILILLTLAAIGGKMLPVGIPSTPVHQLRSEAPQLVDTIPFDVRTTSVKITDGLYTVIRIIDGDTIVIEIDGVQEKIRLIGVDTPEVADPRKPVECFGKEASSFTKNLLTGVHVRLELDTAQGDRDKYGRLLRYVFLSDGMLVNKTIITEGYGHEYTYRMPYHYQTEFKAAQYTARENKKGLWAIGVCATS